MGLRDLFERLCSLGKLLMEAGTDIKDVQCPTKVHIDCVLDAQTGLKAVR